MHSLLTVARRYPPSPKVLPHKGVYSHRRKYPTLRSAVARAGTWAWGLFPSSAALADQPHGSDTRVSPTRRPSHSPRLGRVQSPYAPRSGGLDSVLKLRSLAVDSMPPSDSPVSSQTPQPPQGFEVLCKWLFIPPYCQQSCHPMLTCITSRQSSKGARYSRNASKAASPSSSP